MKKQKVPPSPTNSSSFGRLLARIKRYWITSIMGRPDPVVEAKAETEERWMSVLTRQTELECPAKYFRKTSFKLRKSGDLAAAEDICTRGVGIHPQDLLLAIEHAETARASKNRTTGALRWQHVIDLGGDDAPAYAFKNLADCHHHNGLFTQAESVLSRALQLHPDDFSLKKKLADLLTVNSAPSQALEALKAIITTHPEEDLSSVYLQMAALLTEEGLVGRAAELLLDALAKYPESSEIKERLAELSYLQQKNAPLQEDRAVPTSPEQANPDQPPAYGHGAICINLEPGELKRHVPAMLGFEQTLPIPHTPQVVDAADAFAAWGPPGGKNAAIQNLASTAGKPFLCLESGFLSSPQIEGEDHPVHSVVVSPGNIYYDITRPTVLENRLNSVSYTLTQQQRERSQQVIASIVEHKISKFNHAPRLEPSRFPADGTKRILLIDQKAEAGSLHWSYGGPDAFRRMIKAALSMADHEILVKLHPETISGRVRSQLLPLLPTPLPKNVVLIDYDVNPFDLFDVADEIFVCSSQLGFEALMAGKNVHCFAAPFYSGWGLTTDRMIVPRRKTKRTLHEIFHLFYIEHSRYFVPGKGPVEIEDLITHFIGIRGPGVVAWNAQTSFLADRATDPVEENGRQPLHILIIVHCRRAGASGRYLQNLAWSLINQGCRVMVLAEGKCPALENGVPWRTLQFEGTRLSASLRTEIVAFAPHIVYESGVRSRPQRAALEAIILTNARLVMQSEDDDVQAHETRHGGAAALAMAMVDRPTLDADDVRSFLLNNNWPHTLNVIFDPAFDAWIEPVIRALCYRLASLHTAIWHPFEKRLAEQYKVPTMVVPPVSSRQDFERIHLTPEERNAILTRYGIDPSDTVFFLGGALYPFSNEYSIFLKALNLAHQKTGKQIALVISSGAGRPKLPIDAMARQTLLPRISFTNLGAIGDIGYTEILKACDVVCSPGIPDTFNKFRLPSRLVKAMAMGKPIFTGRCGFGESLEHGHNAFLTDGDDTLAWSEVIADCLDPAQRETVSKNGRLFAEKHFDSDLVAAELKKKFEELMTGPPRGLGDSILHGAAAPTPVDSSQTRSMVKAFSSDRYDSTMQEPINLLKLLTTEIGTVVHVGAGRCKELAEYCRMGAKQVNLVEPVPDLAASLREFENLHGNIHIHEMAVSGISGPQQASICRNMRPDSESDEEMYLLKPTILLETIPSLQEIRKCTVHACTIQEICSNVTFTGENDFLVLEMHGLEAEALKQTPATFLVRFEWIAIQTSGTPLFENGSSFPVIQDLLNEAGYQHIPSAQNFSGPLTAALFRKRQSTV